MMLVIMVAMIAMVATVMAAAPAHAAPIRHIDGQGSQNSGRWQVFDLDNAEVSNGLDVVTWWEGNGNVNVFLLDSRGKTLAFENETGAAPSVVQYNGSTQVDKIAILVKSGSANWSAHLHDFGTAPHLDTNPSPPPTTPQPPTPPATSAYPGQPAAGTILWGASITGNGDPAIHEDPAGATMGIRRTFFQWNQRSGYMVDVARQDVASGRVPWVSVKPPSWRAMARGDHDSQIDAMLRGLDALEGPVWLSIHHEPEGGGGVNAADDPGGPQAHVNMNRRVRQRMNALGTDNIALAPILMAYTWNRYSDRDPEVWWEDGIYDFIGLDHYSYSLEDNLLTASWYEVRAWAEDKGVDIAVGEWNSEGNDRAAYRRVEQWYGDAVGSATDGRGAQVTALAVFENSRWGNLVLRGGRLDAFHDLMARPTSVTQGG